MNADRQPAVSALGGRRAVAEALASGRAREVVVADGVQMTPGLREAVDAARATSVPVRRAPRTELDRLARDHRGIVALLGPATVSSMGERELAGLAFAEDAVVVALDGIEDPQNLGAVARTCDAAGVAELVTRVKRAADATPAAVRASAGALLHLPHARVANITRALERLQGIGFQVAGLDASAEASIYDDPCPTGRVVLVVGSEGSGLSRLVRERCDRLIRLPMGGHVGSLNASAAAAAALYGWVMPSRRR